MLWFCKQDNSQHYIMDINSNEYLENNIKPYGDKVKYHLGESSDSFRKLEGKEIFDLIYNIWHTKVRGTIKKYKIDITIYTGSDKKNNGKTKFNFLMQFI